MCIKSKCYTISKDANCNIFLDNGCSKTAYSLVSVLKSSLVLYNQALGTKTIGINDVCNAEYLTTASLLEDFEDCLGDDTPIEIDMPNHEAASHFELCLNGAKVLFELCKKEDGDRVYQGSNGSSFTNYADIFAAGYTVECVEQVCDCTEVNYTLTEGSTVNYTQLLAHFESTAAFDDGSKGAMDISFVEFGNLAKGGITYTYNGNTQTDFTGSTHYGDDDHFNPISKDFIITSNRGETKIVFTVYKCS